MPELSAGWIASFFRPVAAGRRPRGRLEDHGQSEGQTVQHPILKGIEGGSEQYSGEDVMNALAEVLDRMLPAVPMDDPQRPTLAVLSAGVGSRPRAGRARLESL